jgi:hypothetical protein
MRQWVKTWQRRERNGRDPEREIEKADTQKAIQDLFASDGVFDNLPQRTTSGLVEQQAWFAN